MKTPMFAGETLVPAGETMVKRWWNPEGPKVQTRTLGCQEVALSCQVQQLLQSLLRCWGAINEYLAASFLGGAVNSPRDVVELGLKKNGCVHLGEMRGVKLVDRWIFQFNNCVYQLFSLGGTEIWNWIQPTKERMMAEINTVDPWWSARF